MRMSKKGFTLVEIMIVVAIIGLLAAIAIPSFVKARNTAQQNSCVNNMRLIEAGKDQWATAANQTDGDTVDTSMVNPYIKNNTTPTCAGGGAYTYGNVGSDPNCSGVTVTSHVFRG